MVPVRGVRCAGGAFRGDPVPVKRIADRAAGLARTHPFLLSLIVLLAVVIPGFVRQQQTIDQQHKDQVTLCRSGNEARANQIDLWTFIITLAAEPHPTPVQRQRVAALERRLHEIFAPRDCG